MKIKSVLKTPPLISFQISQPAWKGFRSVVRDSKKLGKKCDKVLEEWDLPELEEIATKLNEMAYELHHLLKCMENNE